MRESGLTSQLARERTFSCCLNANGYYFLQARKKGLLNEKDKRRLKYLLQMKCHLLSNPNFWTEDIGFYLNGVSFVYKRNPMKSATSAKIRVKAKDWK